MAFSTQILRYGWVALTSLGVLTGTTIYVLNNTRQQVKPEDVIEIALGTYERCLATQYGSNLYHVTPPSFIRTWKDSSGNSIIVTNTIGWRVDRQMMIDLDVKIKALVPYFIEPSSWSPETNSFGQILSVTSLWASLEIGDHISQFTRTPERGTNIATYGDYPWQIYPEDLQERYKVLNALKWSALRDKVVTNQSWYGMISDYWCEGIEESWKYKYINQSDGSILYTYDNSLIPMTLGRKSEWEDYYKPTLNTDPDFPGWYRSNNTNYNDPIQGFSTDGTYNVTWKLTWGEMSVDLIEDTFWGYGDCNAGGDIPYHTTSGGIYGWGDFTGYINIGGVEGVYSRFRELDAPQAGSSYIGPTEIITPGTFAWVYKRPNVVSWSGGLMQGLWSWVYCYYTGKATWRWFQAVTNAVPNTLIGVFAFGGFITPKPSPPYNPVGKTEIYSGPTNSWNTWTYPQEWSIDPSSPWDEMAGLSHTNYAKLDVSTDGDWLYMEFGGPEGVTGDSSFMPPHPDEPSDSGNAGPWGSATFWNNSGSRGTARGIAVMDAVIVRDWQFNYCANKYW